MAIDISSAIALIARRILPAAGEIEAPKAFGRTTSIRRYREGMITEAQLRSELQAAGYLGAEIERTVANAKLERDFDSFSDRLTVIQEAYTKDITSFEEMKTMLLEIIPDQAKALQLAELYDYRKRPKPKVVLPEETVTLTIGRLLSAFHAGALTEGQLRTELAARQYSASDIDLLIATEKARMPKPTVPARKTLSISDLRSLFDLGIISAEEFEGTLIDRGYSAADAQRLREIQETRQITRMPKPTPEERKELSLAESSSLFDLGIISAEEFALTLIDRGYSAEDAQLRVVLQQARQMARLPKPAEAEFTILPLGDLRALFLASIISDADLRIELARRKLSPVDIEREVTLVLSALSLDELRVLFANGTLQDMTLRVELTRRNFTPAAIEHELRFLR